MVQEHNSLLEVQDESMGSEQESLPEVVNAAWEPESIRSPNPSMFILTERTTERVWFLGKNS